MVEGMRISGSAAVMDARSAASGAAAWVGASCAACQTSLFYLDILLQSELLAQAVCDGAAHQRLFSLKLSTQISGSFQRGSTSSFAQCLQTWITVLPCVARR
jgi:hypothetical protein